MLLNRTVPDTKQIACSPRVHGSLLPNAYIKRSRTVSLAGNWKVRVAGKRETEAKLSKSLSLSLHIQEQRRVNHFYWKSINRQQEARGNPHLIHQVIVFPSHLRICVRTIALLLDSIWLLIELRFLFLIACKSCIWCFSSSWVWNSKRSVSRKLYL